MRELIIVWTTDNSAVALNMLVLYVVNSKKRAKWDKVNVIISGISAKRLVLYDNQVQREVLRMINLGIDIKASKACNDVSEITCKLEKIGIKSISLNELSTHDRGRIIIGI